MLNQTVLAVRTAIAFPVAFMDVVACVHKLLAKTPLAVAACGVREHLLPIRSRGGVIETDAGEVLTSNVPPILCSAGAAVVELLRHTSSPWRTDMIVDETELKR